MTTPDAAPDFVRAVIGFRQWRVRDDGLWSMYVDERWAGLAHTATCLTPAAHTGPAPQNGCKCGIYAYYDPPARMASAATPELVGGAVTLWGQLEIHAHGMRAEHAAIVALALPLSFGAKRRRLLAAADALGVPVVPARTLRAVALGHGEPIPRAMRPIDTTPNKRAAPGTPDPARLHAAFDGYPRRR
jgi:hypothetical protein